MFQLNFSSSQHDTKVKQKIYAQSLPHILYLSPIILYIYICLFYKTVNEILPYINSKVPQLFSPLNDTETRQVPVGYRCNLAKISACIQKYRSDSCVRDPFPIHSLDTSIHTQWQLLFFVFFRQLSSKLKKLPKTWKTSGYNEQETSLFRSEPLVS